MRREQALGKIFVSHSSKDKPFVRRLAQRLVQEGYQIWLDEKELIPGDVLSSELSEALSQSRAIIVVITPNSLNSRWLKFELNKAIEKMVNNECRLIPILRGEVTPPSELKGIVYADFRKSFGKGMEAVSATLKKEAEEALRGHWAELPVLLREVFDSWGEASAVGGYERFEYDYVQVEGLVDPREPDDDAEIIYDVVYDHFGTSEPLEEQWWSEYLAARDKYEKSLYILISERPIGDRMRALRSRSGKIRVLLRPRRGHNEIIIGVDLSQTTETDGKRALLLAAREELIGLAVTAGFTKPQ